MSMSVKELREELAKFPDDARCYAYEGEIIGIVITADINTYGKQLGVIHCSESDELDAERRK